MGKITLNLWDVDSTTPVWKSFTGEWLVGDDETGLRADDDSRHWDAGAEWSVARTVKGALLVYVTHCNEGFAPLMVVYDDFEAMQANDSIPTNVLAETAAALGEEYEIEMDI